MTTRKSKTGLDAGQLRQGDVLLVSTPNDTKGEPVAAAAERIVLRHGEATGHAHAFYEPSKVSVTQSTKGRHLRVVERALLKHEEHTHIDVPPGIYDLPLQTEWTDSDEPIAVAD